MELTRSGATSEVQRCPFCHSSVSPETEDLVACKQCLARHHRACWDESHRCSSCSGTVPLVAQERALAAGDVVAPVADTRAPDDLRREASRILEEVEQRHEGFTSALLAYPTLGLYPIVSGEKALQSHASANEAAFGPLPTLAEDLKTRIEEARGRAFSKRLGVGRLAFASVAYPLLLTCAILSIILINSAHWTGWGWSAEYDAGIVLGVIGYVGFQFLLFVQLHWFREAVRRHEYDQFYARLVSDAVHPTRIKEITEARTTAWSKRRLDDVLASLGALGLGPIVMLPLLAKRMRTALALHLEHEEQLLHTGAARKVNPE